MAVNTPTVRHQLRHLVISSLAGLTLLIGLPAFAAPDAPASGAPASNGIGTTAQTSPKPQADAAAHALLKVAHDMRQVMPADFSGFDATVVYSSGDKTATGTLHYRTTGKTTLDVNGLAKDDQDWLEDQVLSILGHRSSGNFAQGDGRYPLTFGQAADNDFGKLIELNDGMQSSYRVRDNKITEVTRVGGNLRFTISVLQTMEADKGKYLPIHFMVAYRDKTSGVLQQVEGYRDAYAKVHGVWLPASRIVVAFDNQTSAHLRHIQFRDIKLLPAAKAG